MSSTIIDDIKKIRELLTEIELQAESPADCFDRNYNALELPDIIVQVANYLQPQLLPYEAVIYLYMFANSIAIEGSQRIRVSVRSLCSGVVKSSSGQGDKLSYGSVQEALAGLERKQCIRKEGDTNRNGTLYFVFLPEEIEMCVDSIKKSFDKEKNEVVVNEIDYYNIQENRLKIFDRDGYQCYYCKKQLTRFSATLDHIQPVSHGGLNSFDNLTTACLHCNSRRGNRPIMDALLE